MQPYGIVYEENIFSLEQGVLLLHKKYGVLKKTALLKIVAMLFLFYFAAGVLSFIVAGDIYYPILVALLFLINTAMLPYTVKKSYVNPTAKANFQRGKKQIVLFDDRLEYTTNYGRSVFYYEDIVFANECGGTITIVLDTATIPLCVPAKCIKKGEYKTFLSLLILKMGAKMQTKEGTI